MLPSNNNSAFPPSGFCNDGDAAVELRFVESEAQTERLGEGDDEGVEVGQAAARSHLGERDGSRTVVHGHADSVAFHVVQEAGLPPVVPGCQLSVVLLRQTPRELEQI